MTIFGHAALGATVYGALRPHATTTRWGLSRNALLLLCLLLPVFPDADAVMHRWVKYGHILGHRGFSHSLFFALIFSIAVAWLLQRLGYADKGRQAFMRMTLAFSLLMASHTFVDTMTTGGKAPSVFWPLKSEGVWFPERFIPVSPMGATLIRTKWTQKQLADMKKARTRLLKTKSKPFMLVRKVVSWSKRPDHYRRLGLLGIALTEFLLLAPFALGVVIFAAWRRWKSGPATKDPPKVRPPPQAPPEGSPARLWLAVLASGLALTAAMVVGWFAWSPDAGISVTSGHLDDDASTHYHRVAPEDVGDDAPVAVLVHGWRCSHQMMMPLARALARNGVEVWNIDMPGHARSPIPLESGCRDKKRTCNISSNGLFTRATASVLDHLFEAGGFADRDVVLIGHSTGAVAAHDVSGKGANSLAGRVVIEGRYGRLKHGGNRLIVGKPNYLKKGSDGLELDVLHGSFEDRSATELFTANRPHLELIRDANVNAKVLSWIEGATGASLGDAAEPYIKRYFAWAFILAAVGLALSTLGASFASRRGWLPPVCPSGYPRPGIAFLCMVFGSFVAMLWAGELFRAGQPFWLRGTIGQVMPIYLMCASVCIGVPYVVLTRRPGRPQLRSLAVDSAFAVLVFATIYLTVGLAIDSTFFHLGVAAWRWVYILAFTVAFLPVSLVVQEIGFESDRWYARIATLFVHGLLWGAIFFLEGKSWGPVDDSYKLAGLVMVAESWALCVGWRRRSRFFAALVTSLVLAWFLIAAYPVLAGAPA